MGGLSVILSLLACVAREDLPARLPSEVSIVAREGDGDYVSILVPLRRNARHEVDARVARGIRLYDGDHLWAMVPAMAEDGWTIEVQDLIGTPRATLPLGALEPPTLTHIDRGRVWATVDGEHVVCTIATTECSNDREPTPMLPWRQVGPGAGFRVDLDEGGTLRLRLPIEGDESPGSIISTDIDSVVAIRWVRTLLPLDREDLNRAFRGLGVVSAVDTEITLDGELQEWESARPLVVDARWQVDTGMDGWEGDRDASFSLAASWRGDRLCLAGRVRDDAVVPGDKLVVQVAGIAREIGAQDADTPLARVRPVHFGTTFETCFADVPLRGEPLPFTASMVDVDPTGPITVLRAAPYSDGRPQGAIRHP